MKPPSEAEWRKRPEGRRHKTWGLGLHHDNAPAHTSLLIHEFLGKHETTVIPNLPYSLDLVSVVEIHSQKLSISGDKKTCYGTYMLSCKTCSRQCSRTGEMLEVIYRQWRGVLWRRQFLLSCKPINKCIKKKVRLLFGQTMQITNINTST
jgi:hypothetical protein